jgi:hypothetical protein
MPPRTCSAIALRQIEAKARQYWSQWDRHESRYVHPTVNKIRGKEKLFLDRRRHKSVPNKKNPQKMVSCGKPKRDAMRAYVKALFSIYEQATGKQLGRINIKVMRPKNLDRSNIDDILLNKALPKDHATHKAKHIPFIQVCVRAVGAKYPSRIIQEELEQFHED